MGGMALGSGCFPGWCRRRFIRCASSRRWRRASPLFGILIPLALPYVQQAYVALGGLRRRRGPASSGGLRVVLTPPTMLMGATLPAISRWLDQRHEARVIGRLPLHRQHRRRRRGHSARRVLPAPRLRHGRGGRGGGGDQLLVARRVSGDGNDAHAQRADAPSAPRRSHGTPTPAAPLAPIYLVAAMSGFTALGAEVVWTRQLSLLFGASVYTFSLILAVFLAGLGVGSLAGSSIARRSNDPRWRARHASRSLLAFAIAFGAWMIVHGLPLWQPTRSFLPWVRSSPPLTFAFDAIRCAIALMPATMLWGASFPLTLAAAGSTPFRGHVSRITAINTAGALLGASSLTLIGIPMMEPALAAGARADGSRQRPR